MAPSAVDIESNQSQIHSTKSVFSRKPLKSSGAIEQYKSEDITPVIGTEFPDANLVQWLGSDNADELLRDLAIKSKLILPCSQINPNIDV
jgi:hypothetical protein